MHVGSQFVLCAWLYTRQQTLLRQAVNSKEEWITTVILSLNYTNAESKLDWITLMILSLNCTNAAYILTVTLLTAQLPIAMVLCILASCKLALLVVTSMCVAMLLDCV